MPWKRPTIPERALAAAESLAQLVLRAPAILVHMPSHIYSRIGDFDAAALANEKAAAVDRAYINRFKVKGIYAMMYFSHNLHFLAVAHAMQGRFSDAASASEQLANHVGPHVQDMPMLEFFLPTATLIQVRFQRWDDILASKAPDEKLTIVKSVWHYARGLAFTAQGKVKEAQQELAVMGKLYQAGMPEDLQFGARNLAKKVPGDSRRGAAGQDRPGPKRPHKGDCVA